MKRVVLLCLLLFVASCSSGIDETISDVNNDVLATGGQNYVLFTLNVHDWVDPEESSSIVEKTIEIHEKYNVPLDIYIDDQVLQIYLKEYPEVIERMKNSEVVSVSYHVRASLPIYTGFDIFGYSKLSKDQLYDLLLPYEEHKLNISSALPVESEPGGYQLLKDTLGYAPVAASLIFDTSAEQEVMAQIYEEKGALLGVIHNDPVKLGSEKYGLKLRPEDVEIKLYEKVDGYASGKLTPEKIINDAISHSETINNPLFINLKMHENNYYTHGNPFYLAFFETEDSEVPLNPPYDLTRAEPEFRTEEEQEQMLALYEDTVSYVSEHPELYKTIDNEDIVKMLNI